MVAGLRKNWSICFSISDSDARSSCTTLPMVWRSETRRYSSSIHASSGSGGCPWRTPREPFAEALDALGMLGVIEVVVLERRVDVQQAVATSIASGARRRGLRRLRLLRRGLQLGGERLAVGKSCCSESPTSANCSARPARRCRSPPATADHASLAAATRFRACASIAGSKRPRRCAS